MASLSFGLELTGAGLRNNMLLKKKKDKIDRPQSLKDRQKFMTTVHGGWGAVSHASPAT